MQKRFTLGGFILVACAIVAGQAGAALRDSKIVAVSAKDLFVPVGFDDNDEVIAVIDGYLPDPCHKLKDPEVKVDARKKTITLTPRAVIVTGVCADVIVPYIMVARLGTLAQGQYQVKIAGSRLVEKLSIKKATLPGPDDHLYAAVDSSRVVFNSEGKMVAHIAGRFTSTCLVMDEVKLTNSGKTFEVLPIMKRLDKDPEGRQCARKERPFEATVNLPDLAPGRYLLHVRSLNGQAVNEIFSNLWRQ